MMGNLQIALSLSTSTTTKEGNLKKNVQQFQKVQKHSCRHDSFMGSMVQIFSHFPDGF